MIDKVNPVLKLRYKIEIHKRKGKKNETYIKYHWKNKKSDKYGSAQIDYCCNQMDSALGAFVTVETDQNHFTGIKYEDKRTRLKEPIICLHSMDESGYGDEGCPHEEIVLPINNCPFCAAKIEYECIEKKRITHECVKVKREYEDCEDKTTEEIL